MVLAALENIVLLTRNRSIDIITMALYIFISPSESEKMI